MQAQAGRVMNQQLLAQLDSGLESLSLTLSTSQKNDLLAYLELLQKWNSAFNLSGISDASQMLTRHLLDSLTLLPFLDGDLIVDIGTGAGLPGIPLAIACPEKKFILLDSNGKKTRFLFQVAVSLGLKHVEIENCRVEHYQSSQQIDIVTCRAFSSLAETINQARLLIGEGSKLLAMKGHVLAEELDAVPPDFQLESVIDLKIPGLEETRNLVVVTHRS